MNLDKNSQCNEIIQDKNTKMKQNTHINSLVIKAEPGEKQLSSPLSRCYM